jgi:hypothetical protein
VAVLIVARRGLHAACCGVLRTPTLLALFLAAAIGCNRSASAPEPVAPVQPVAPRAPSAEPAAALPAEPAPPKEAVADAPQTATAAPAQPLQPGNEEKPAIGAPVAPEPVKPDAKKRSGRTRQIRRTIGNPACIEMYGTCTPPPDQICTSSALYVDCGQRAQVPSSGEWVHCVCD